MRVAVVGHVEWIEFASVELGSRARAELRDRGVRVEAATRPLPQRRALTLVDDAGERTIITLGERLSPRRDDPLPWEELEGADAVYFVAGDVGALRAARAARVVTATSRILPTLIDAGVQLDAVIGSGRDEAERYTPGAMQPPPELVVRTAGRDGGSCVTADGRSGTWAAVALPGPIKDTYGAGDSFAAGVTFALGAGSRVEDALAFGAMCGAAGLSGKGAYEGQLGRADWDHWKRGRE